MTETKRVRLPTIQDRVMIIGATGEGKTVGGLSILSYAPFHLIPYIIFDYKRDKLVSQIEDAGAIVLYDDRLMPGQDFPEPPITPGLYIIRPDPGQKDEVDEFLSKVWRNGNTGLFCDEAFQIPQKHRYKSYDRLLTQGRSLNCPMIMLYQRPVDMSQYATSQSEFWGVYKLRKQADIDIANEYVGQTVINGQKVDVNTALPRYYWLWYDVNQDYLSIMSPVSAPDEVIKVFRARLSPPELEEEIDDESRERSALELY